MSQVKLIVIGAAGLLICAVVLLRGFAQEPQKVTVPAISSKERKVAKEETSAQQAQKDAGGATTVNKSASSGGGTSGWTTTEDLEERKHQLERERFDEERKSNSSRDQIEREKLYATVAAIAIPFLLAIATARYQAQANFELKAAEIIMNSPNPGAVKTKADVLRTIFRGRLPKDFCDNFKPEVHGTRFGHESRWQLLKLLAANPEKREAIVDLYLRVFPHDLETIIKYSRLLDPPIPQEQKENTPAPNGNPA